MYISKPKKPQPRLDDESRRANGKGIVLIHEFWGVNDQMRRTADKLSGEGFYAIAADLYKGKVAGSIEEARKMKDEVNDDEALAEIGDCISKLGEKGIKPEKIAVWGFCMGGSFAYLAATRPIKAGAYVIYYGSRISDDEEKLANISAPVLGIFGGLDKGIPRDLVSRFGQALEDLKKTNEIDIYDDADHAFANEERASYNAKAAKDAWGKTMAFLDKYL